MIWGVWTDDEKNIYAAVTSDQTVIRIDTMGTMTDVYTSEGTWGPLHGVLDEDNNMWILENSDKNVVRVKLVKNVNGIKDRSNRLDPHSMLSIILFCILLMLF